MSANNNCTFYGRLTKNIELRYSASGTAVGTSSVAVDAVGKEGKRIAQYFPLVAFGKTAETLSKYFGKGSRILVNCQANQNIYTDREGKKRYEINFVVDNFSFVDTREESVANGTALPKGNSQQPQPVPTTTTAPDSDGFMQIPDGLADEMPFQ